MTVSSDAVATLTSQFAAADLTQGLLGALLGPFDEIDDALAYLRDHTHLGDAAGQWLDWEGEIVGTRRLLGETPDDQIFTFVSGTQSATSTTQGFDGGYLRSVYGNYIPGTLMADLPYERYTLAKANATFKGTSLRDIVDFIYDVFGVSSRAEFVEMSDVYVYLDGALGYSAKRIIEQYAPVSAGSTLYVVT